MSNTNSNNVKPTKIIVTSPVDINISLICLSLIPPILNIKDVGLDVGIDVGNDDGDIVGVADGAMI